MTTETRPNSFRKLFFGLFVFPLVIAVGMAVLLCAVVLMTSESETPDSLIAAIKTGSPSKRWQKAYELSNELNRRAPEARSERLMDEIISILGDARRYDAKTRGYMALALGRWDREKAVQALSRAAADPSSEVAVYALWSLAGIGSPSGIPAASGALKHEDPDIRKTAAYALGLMSGDTVRPALAAALKDPVDDVRWNAALALARHGDGAGREELNRMLDRSHLSGALGLNEARIEQTMINAARGLALIPEPSSIRILESLSREDRSLKVRQAAITALQEIRKAQAS